MAYNPTDRERRALEHIRECAACQRLEPCEGLEAFREPAPLMLPMTRIDRPDFVGATVEGQPVFYREYELPAECSRAIGWGVSGSRFQVPVAQGHPHVKVYPELVDGAGAWIAQAHKIEYVK